MYLKDKKIKMKTLLYPVLLATTIMAASCTNNQDDVTEVIDPSNKTAISFVGQDNSRLGTRYGFEGNTHIAMHIRSNKGGLTTDGNVRETRTMASALKDATQSDVSFSSIEAPSDENVRYWDDAFGRSAHLSVFAVAVPGKDNSLKNNNTTLTNLLTGDRTWSNSALSEEIAWTVSADQSGADVIGNEDLTYSNNISSAGEGGVKSYNYTSSAYDTANDGCLQFRLKDGNMQDGPGKFDQGNLKFNHALSRITVNLVKGTGYSEGSFKFAEGTNVKVLGVPTTGTLDIEKGTWTTTDKTGISKMAEISKASGADYSLQAQILPTYTFTDGSDVNVLEFIIDDNKYFVTQDMMLDALNKGQNTSVTSLTMSQGKNYVFTITVGKSKIINVTAKLEKWVDVEAANQDMDNSHIKLSLFNNTDGTAITTETFDLYRLNDGSEDINTGSSSAKNWGGNYTAENKATLTYNKSNSKWETNWFFDDNKSFYHFRSVNKNIKIEGSDSATDDYFEITSGPVANTDPHWGAPFVNNPKYDVSEGYKATLSPAIGATNSAISMTELHMMSNIKVLLKTTDGANKVTLDNAKVYITKFHSTAHVLMGNGLVTPTDDITTEKEMTAAGTEFTYAIVPQALVRSATPTDDDYVGITIVTTDNNQYYIVKKLSEIKATSVTNDKNQTKDSAIIRWFPGHTYTYTFTLTKAGISNVTCTVQGWVDVTATNKDITLED